MDLPVNEIRCWNGLVELEAELALGDQEWAFRGQSSLSHPLQSTLERVCKDFEVKDGAVIANIEQAILADFKRSCHVYAPQAVPRDEDDTLGWFALMRHYGAPCRFLDFTFSLFVACYFAAEPDKADPVIWAVNKSWLSRTLESVFDRMPDGAKVRESWYSRTDHSAFTSLFVERRPKVDLVVPLNPFQMNDRLLVQQGLFICCTDVTASFEAVLGDMPECAANVRRFHIETPEARREILERLHRTAVNGAALFHGLQGFAGSLRSKVLTYLRLQNLRDRQARMGPAIIGV